MDPLGLGPVSMSFTMGGVLTPYTKAMFLELVKRVQRPNRKYKVVLGGPGAWHFDYRQEMQASLGIDHIVHGEVDQDRKSTRLNSSHGYISYAVFCLKKKKKKRGMITSEAPKRAGS